jgi:hypothetical protein
MNVYAVIATSQETISQVGAAVQSRFPDNHMRINDSCWLIADPLDVKSVSKKLGVAEGATPSTGVQNVLVIWVIGYWGHASMDMWSWMAQKIQQQTVNVVAQSILQSTK